MNNLLPEKISKEDKLSIPQYVQNDVNLYYLPFFSNKKWELKPKRIELEIKEENKVLRWLVSPHPEFGTPSFFDKKVYYAFLSIIEEKGLQNPLIPFTFREIARRMNIAINGQNVESIKRAINRIKLFQKVLFMLRKKKQRFMMLLAFLIGLS